MGVFEQFPYANMHEMNLEWLLKKMKELDQAMETFKATESLKFADPIIWDITTQYEKSTIVLDPTGNAYLSLQSVPAGVQLNNEEYWLEIFNFTDYTRTANKNLTINVETNTTRASRSYFTDDWLILNDVLYKVTSNIDIDDTFIIAPASGSNLIHFTVEDFIKSFITYATNLINQYKNEIDASELAYRQELAQDIANTTASLQTQLNTIISGATVDSEVIAARVGYDNNTYSTLGDAIRTQIQNIITAIDAIDSNFDVSTVSAVQNQHRFPRTYNFVAGHWYKMKVEMPIIANTVQFGSYDADNNVMIDATPVLKYNNVPLEFTFKATQNATNALLYVDPVPSSTVTFTIIDMGILPSITPEQDLSILSSNPVMNKTVTENILFQEKLLETVPPNAAANFYWVRFKRGERYLCHLVGEPTSNVLQASTLPADTITILDSSPAYTGATDTYWEFTATSDAERISFYCTGSNPKFFEVFHLINKGDTNRNELRSTPANNIYSFNGIIDDVIDCPTWVQNADHISRSHSGNMFIDGAVFHKYITAYNRVYTYDFAPQINAIIAGYTQCAGFENLYEQGYCITVDFVHKELAIRNKYGANDRTISTVLPSVYKSVSFTAASYAGVKYRLEIERNNQRGIIARLYELESYTLLATVSTGFLRGNVPDYGLGYDYPAFAVLQGSTDLYHFNVKIKNASDTFLYIVGDSITEGADCLPDEAWAYMVAKDVGKTVVSGRGGGTHAGAYNRILDEASELKPKYIMLTIGTNGSPSLAYLTNVKTKIEELGAIPIINCIPCQAGGGEVNVNNIILQLDCIHVRFDIATALNHNLQNGQDASLFTSDGIHPNPLGYLQMYNRVKIDCPFLFS